MKKSTLIKLAWGVLMFCPCKGQKKENSLLVSMNTISARVQTVTKTQEKAPANDALCDLIDSPDEVKLDYGDPSKFGNVYSYSTQTLATSRRYFDKIFNFENPADRINNPDQAINATELCRLAKYIKDNLTPGPKDLKGIRMLYGIDGYVMFCMFEPVLLKFQGGTEPHYDVKRSLMFYRPNSSGNLELIPTKDTLKYTDPYRSESSRMDITHMEFPDHIETNKFIDKDDDFLYGDTKFSVMPLQQIFRMFKENKGVCTDATDNKIYFSLLANNYFMTRGINIFNYKLHVVAHYKIGVLPPAENSYAGFGADFSQMSPPNNGYVVLPKEIINERKMRFDDFNLNKKH
jgi:hypothetical protein